MIPVALQAMPVAVSVAFGAVGVVLLALGAREGWRAVRYWTRRPTAIGDLGDRSGRVVVTGVARRADEVLEAPLSGRSCLAYTWRAAAIRTTREFDGGLDTRGRRAGGGRDAVPFLVEDDTGSLAVDPDGADLRLAEEWVRDPVTRPGDAGRSTLGGAVDDLLGERTHARRYYEGRLDEGETVTVRGRLAAGDDPLAAGRVGVSVSGGGLVADATPRAAARRALSRAATSAGIGLFVLVVVALFSL